jgi:hypothetical protein
MEVLPFLVEFYHSAAANPRIGATHISLYIAFFQHWGKNGFRNPVEFTSREIMPLAKIESRATYHRCLRELVECGYIRYIPSCNPFLKSIAFLEASINN